MISSGRDAGGTAGAVLPLVDPRYYRWDMEFLLRLRFSAVVMPSSTAGAVLPLLYERHYR